MAVSRKALSRIPKAQFPCRLTTNFLLCFGYHVGRLESKQKDQLVVIRTEHVIHYFQYS
jgi:hypothetical protein